jgi:hypothetical protein
LPLTTFDVIPVAGSYSPTQSRPSFFTNFSTTTSAFSKRTYASLAVTVTAAPVLLTVTSAGSAYSNASLRAAAVSLLEAAALKLTRIGL